MMDAMCIPWQIDTSCSPGWEDLDPDLQERAAALSWRVIRMLTGGSVGSCPVLMRPCAQVPCTACALPPLPGLLPACRGEGCSCTPIHEVLMPGQVADVIEVKIDGEAQEERIYRLLDGRRLVRTDGAAWPSCQHLDLDDDQPGTFSIQYVPGLLPGPDGLWAAGVLASEFAKACTSGKCRLPSSVVSIVRQGVSMQFGEGMFTNNLTGIREVDAWVSAINPYGLRSHATVWSPDMPSHRFDTPRHGAAHG